MIYLFLGNLGMLEILIALVILMVPIVGIFFLGYFLGKNSAKKASATKSTHQANN